MQKIIENIRKYLKIYIIFFAIFSALGTGIFLIFYFVQHQTIVASLNGTGVAFAFLVASGGLSWLARAGAFDTMSYGFNQMFASMFGKEANKYNDMVSYKEEKNTKRAESAKTYLSIFVSSIPFLVAFVVLEIVKSTIF